VSFFQKKDTTSKKRHYLERPAVSFFRKKDTTSRKRHNKVCLFSKKRHYLEKKTHLVVSFFKKKTQVASQKDTTSMRYCLFSKKKTLPQQNPGKHKLGRGEPSVGCPLSLTWTTGLAITCPCVTRAKRGVPHWGDSKVGRPIHKP